MKSILTTILISLALVNAAPVPQAAVPLLDGIIKPTTGTPAAKRQAEIGQSVGGSLGFVGGLAGRSTVVNAKREPALAALVSPLPPSSLETRQYPELPSEDANHEELEGTFYQLPGLARKRQSPDSSLVASPESSLGPQPKLPKRQKGPNRVGLNGVPNTDTLGLPLKRQFPDTSAVPVAGSALRSVSSTLAGSAEKRQDADLQPLPVDRPLLTPDIPTPAFVDSLPAPPDSAPAKKSQSLGLSSLPPTVLLAIKEGIDAISQPLGLFF